MDKRFNFVSTLRQKAQHNGIVRINLFVEGLENQRLLYLTTSFYEHNLRSKTLWTRYKAESCLSPSLMSKKLHDSEIRKSMGQVTEQNSTWLTAITLGIEYENDVDEPNCISLQAVT